MGTGGIEKFHILLYFVVEMGQRGRGHCRKGREPGVKVQEVGDSAPPPPSPCPHFSQACTPLPQISTNHLAHVSKVSAHGKHNQYLTNFISV